MNGLHVDLGFENKLRRMRVCTDTYVLFKETRQHFIKKYGTILRFNGRLATLVDILRMQDAFELLRQHQALQ